MSVSLCRIFNLAANRRSRQLFGLFIVRIVPLQRSIDSVLHICGYSESDQGPREQSLSVNRGLRLSLSLRCVSQNAYQAEIAEPTTVTHNL